MNEVGEVRLALLAEFPGWLVEVTESEFGVSFEACRPLAPGHGGPVDLYSDDLALFRELLEDADRGDSRLAIRALAAGLAVRGIRARPCLTTLGVGLPGQDERLITCRRGLFHWAQDDRRIGPITDTRLVIRRVVDAIRMAPHEVTR
ncbi:hypothetical protein [Actinomadura macra]|uniref:hypothetical protein n=1 Tax=Actinomadura macra TaxID=46164 RepID=UPI0008375D33|nr:hypothetical protein [Actinomadura macra]